jgi:peptide/nickel transport system permease protein
MRSILIRLLRLLVVLFLVSLGTFFIIELVPGDPAVAILGQDATPERIAEIHTELGLDHPIGERYVDWLQGVLRGDLGDSLVNQSQSVSDLIKQSLPVTLEIAFLALVMSLVIAIPTALISAAKADGAFDRGTTLLTSALISIPTFLAALLLAYFFVFEQAVPRWTFLVLGLIGAAAMLRSSLPRDGEGFRLWFVLGAVVLAGIGLAIWNWFPNFDRTGFIRITAEEGVRENLKSAFLPALSLALAEAAVFTRLLRSDLIATLQEDFILSARATGVPSRRLLVVHALRPSSFSLITVAGVSLGRLIGGTVIVETVFGLPGMGRLIVNSGVLNSDYTIVQGGVLVIAVFYVLINAAVDGAYVLLDPRVRRG